MGQIHSPSSNNAMILVGVRVETRSIGHGALAAVAHWNPSTRTLSLLPAKRSEPLAE
jgi:hypothetical protein